MKRNAWIGLTAALVVVGGATVYVLKSGKEEVKFRTAAADLGNITQRISATGTINALIQVPVGTQVSGVVTGLYADFNSLVKKGQVIGQIDPTPWLTSLREANAQMDKARVALANAKVDYARNKKLWELKLLDDADLDAKDLVLKTATAQVESAKAGIAAATTNLGYCTIKAPVDGLVVARLVDVGQTVAASFATPSVFVIAQSLDKMKVQAAIDEADIGQVRVGQRAFFTVDSYSDKQFHGTVTEVQLNPVISQNVVTYNVIMEVTNEPRTTYSPELVKAEGEAGAAPGVGAPRDPAGRGHHSKPGSDPATQAHPVAAAGQAASQPHGGRAGHHGSEGTPAVKAPAGMNVPQLATLETATARYIPKGSPVYKADLALFPGMTANCTIVTNRRQDTLRVPAVALRFNPNAFMKDAEKKLGAPGAPSGQRAAGASSGRGMVAKRDDHVWILEKGKPKLLAVKAGISDGSFTEISGEGVAAGLVVLTGIDDPAKKALAAQQGGSPLGGGGGGRH